MAKLEIAKRHVAWALSAAPSLLPKTDASALTAQGDMWILAHGFANAFYSIKETLFSVEMQGDPILRAVVVKWWGSGVKRDHAQLLGEFRRSLTHQAKFDLQSRTDWEVNHHLDTVEPRYSYPFARLREPDGSITDYAFPEWIRFCFEWWDKHLTELERLYVAAGGVVSPDPTSWSDHVWGRSNHPPFPWEEGGS